MRTPSLPENYNLIAKTLHWLTALLFLGAYISVYYRHWFTEAKTPENWSALQWHLSFGVSIGVLVLLRVIWRVMSTLPKEEPGTPIEHRAARLGHLALYAIMIIMPITGYFGTGATIEYFFLFDLTEFPETWIFTQVVENGLGITFETFETPLDFIHKDILGAWVVWLLILGHALAALYHHFIKKDRTLKKMTFERVKH